MNPIEFGELKVILSKKNKKTFTLRETFELETLIIQLIVTHLNLLIVDDHHHHHHNLYHEVNCFTLDCDHNQLID